MSKINHLVDVLERVVTCWYYKLPSNDQVLSIQSIQCFSSDKRKCAFSFYKPKIFIFFYNHSSFYLIMSELCRQKANLIPLYHHPHSVLLVQLNKWLSSGTQKLKPKKLCKSSGNVDFYSLKPLHLYFLLIFNCALKSSISHHRRLSSSFPFSPNSRPKLYAHENSKGKSHKSKFNIN